MSSISVFLLLLKLTSTALEEPGAQEEKGQDGSYLAELLLDKGYDVHGVIRRSSVDFRERITHLEGHPNFHLHYADLGDSMSIMQVVAKVRPDEMYNYQI